MCPTPPTTRTAGEPRWLLLIHQIPPKPDYLRVKIGRRLQRVGAVAIKNSVYVLPDTGQALEDFQWIRTEILEGGGDASICRAELIDGLTADHVRGLFRRARRDDYDRIAAAARVLLRAPRATAPDGEALGAASADQELARLRRRFARARAVDFFDAPERRAAQDALDAAAARLKPPGTGSAGAARAARPAGEYHGRTWVTRADVFVDRIASAWLIRTFIDPAARFRFVPAQGYRAREGELRFDMYDGELTHQGDHCTFETLLERFALAGDPALAAIGEIVHDIDLKDGKFARPETPGVERLVAGVAHGTEDDAERLERGGALFDALYASMRDTASAAAASTGARRPRGPRQPAG